MKRVNLKIYGQVQGVFYRAQAKAKGAELGLVLEVENEPDGTVKITAQGREEDLKKLIKWCWQGPPSAKVEKIDIKWL